MNWGRPTKPDTTRRAIVRTDGPRGSADYKRRLAAAGMRDDADPADMPIDDFRMALARRIAMAINRCTGCREPLCRRNRGCMAPEGACSNIPRGPRDPVAEARAMAQMQRALTRELERRAAETEM